MPICGWSKPRRDSKGSLTIYRSFRMFLVWCAVCRWLSGWLIVTTLEETFNSMAVKWLNWIMKHSKAMSFSVLIETAISRLDWHKRNTQKYRKISRIAHQSYSIQKCLKFRAFRTDCVLPPSSKSYALVSCWQLSVNRLIYILPDVSVLRIPRSLKMFFPNVWWMVFAYRLNN